MTRDRIVSSLALPPALRMTCASPSDRSANFAGSILASMHVRIANRLEGGMGNVPLFPNRSAYSRFAASTSSTILLIVALASWRGLLFTAFLYRIPF